MLWHIYISRSKSLADLLHFLLCNHGSLIDRDRLYLRKQLCHQNVLKCQLSILKCIMNKYSKYTHYTESMEELNNRASIIYVRNILWPLLHAYPFSKPQYMSLTYSNRDILKTRHSIWYGPRSNCSYYNLLSWRPQCLPLRAH